MKLQTQKKPLFIYDWYNTVEGPLWTAYMLVLYQEQCLAKAEGREHCPSKTMADFRSQYRNQKTILIPGMEETIRFTSSIGNNILLSDGDHLGEACPELLALAGYFRPWVFEGELIEFGRKPAQRSKADPEVAEALIRQFDPNIIFVIGDSNAEAKLAESLHADTFIFCGLDRRQITNGKTLPHVEQLVTGYPMIRYIEERLKKEMPHILKSEKAQRKQLPYRNLGADRGR